MPKKYSHQAIRWYVRRHIAMMDDAEFTELQPPRNLKEKKERLNRKAGQTLKKVENVADNIGEKLYNGGIILEHKTR